MNPIRWCHCSDAHLGYKQYNLLDRLKDFASAFNKCISLIMDQDPDFVIFTGDLFEHYNPNPPELRQAVEILRKLKESPKDGHEIPIYVVPGNHDVSYSASKRYGGDILEFLQDLELIHYLHDTYEIVKKDNKPIAIIAGLHYYGKKTPGKLKEFYEANKEIFERTDIPKILMLHAFVEGTVPKYDISAYALNMYPFDYIAVGHYHIRWPMNFNDKKNKVVSTGGTEHRTSAEWDHDRGFISVKAEKLKDNWEITPEFIKFEVREKKVIHHDFNLTNANEVIKYTSDLIQKNDREGIILKLYLKGTLKKGDFSFLNLQNLKNQAKNALYIDITNHITATTTTSTTPKNDREAFIEVFKNNFNVKKENLDNYVALIETIIKIANDRDFNELNAKILDDFITKAADAIQIQETIEPPIKLSKTDSKSRKKLDKIKKLDSFK
ncbi:MAG TPA: exonuclease SbcCD subunit D [Candidatus Deferrimicrobium sp.]|nr:exonuclease SbcCD subunit D [Candidatus Deferrimicrobium sp.]